MKVVGLIPVRLESTRLPRKALKIISGIPAIVHVFKRCMLSKKLDEVFVVTDSLEIKNVVEKYGGNVIITKKCSNGSERIYEASKKINYKYIINIQGDEILVDPKNIDKLILSMKRFRNINFFIGVTNFNLENQKNVFKAVIDKNKNLIYCSREDIPSSSIIKNNNRLKVVFLVGYSKYSLKKFVNWKTTKNELREPNEFLRILDNGKIIKTIHFKEAFISLDTINDLQKIRNQMKKDKYFLRYSNQLYGKD